MPRPRDRSPKTRAVNPIVKQIVASIPSHMTREDVADKAGYGAQNVQSWLAGRYRMPLDAAIDLAQVLGYRVTLVKIEGEKK